jgi:RNA polymerase sigma-70 factor, ECF subfamily
MSSRARHRSSLRAPDLARYEEAVRHASPRLLAVANRYLHDPEEAADVLQDALLASFRSLDRYEGRAQLSTWLHRIVVNAALMRLRGRRRRPEVPLADGGRRLACAADGPELLLDRTRRSRRVRDAVAKLPESTRAAVASCDLLELDRVAAARSLGISRDALKMRLHRGRRALREELVNTR